MVTLGALTLGPGADLLRWRSSSATPTVGPEPVRPPAAELVPRPPQVAAGEVAVTIQDPPLGLPRQVKARIGNNGCSVASFGAHPRRRQLMVMGETSIGGGKNVFLEVVPWSVNVNLPRGPNADVALFRDGEAPRGVPILAIDGPSVKLDLRHPGGREGTMTGRYSIIRNGDPYTSDGPPYHILRGPTDARFAIAWKCKPER